MGRRIFARAWIFAALTLVAAGPALAQQPEVTPEQQAMLQEFQQLQQRVAMVEQQAMQQNPELQEELANAQGAVIAAMIELRPETRDHLERLETLEGEIRSAQQAQDGERMQSLMLEAVSLTEQLNDAQAEAMEREDVAARLDAFQDHLLSRMVAIEPETEAMIARMQEIAQQLQ